MMRPINLAGVSSDRELGELSHWQCILTGDIKRDYPYQRIQPTRLVRASHWFFSFCVECGPDFDTSSEE